MREELTIYRSTCDACDDIEDSDTDDVPFGWEETSDGFTYGPTHSKGADRG